jgi:hypothetical protein
MVEPPVGQEAHSARLTSPAAHRLVELQRTVGNRAARRLARKPAPKADMKAVVNMVEEMGREGVIWGAQQKVDQLLSNAPTSARVTQLASQRVLDAYTKTDRFARGKKHLAPRQAAEDFEKSLERKRIEGTIASAPSIWHGFKRAEQSARSPHYHQQATLLKRDIEIVQDEFRDRARENALSLLDSSQRRVETMLKSYGLVTAFADEAIKKVSVYGGELETEVEKWHERAQKGQTALYDAASGLRGKLNVRVEELRELQGQVVRKQVVFLKRWNTPPLDEADRRAKDKAVKKLGAAASRVSGTITDEARKEEREIQAAGRELAAAWINAEREHPVLAAHRDGRQRHLEWVDLTTYEPTREPALPALQAVEINRAAKRLGSTVRKGAHERAVIRQGIAKLVNIRRARLALQQGLLSPLKLRPVVEFTREQMVINPKSVWGKAIYEVVKPHLGPLRQGLEFVKSLFEFALMVLAAVPNPAQPLAVMYDVASGAYTTMDEYVKYTLQKSYANTDLDRAKSISDEEPSLTGFALALLGTGMSIVDARAVFKEAAALQRAARHGDSAAQKRLDELLERYDGQKRRPDAPTPQQSPAASRPVQQTGPPPLHPDLSTSDLKFMAHHNSAREMREQVEWDLRALQHQGDGPTMTEFLEIIGDADINHAPTAELVGNFRTFYRTLRDPLAHADFAAFVWRYAARRRITTVQALEEIVAGNGGVIHVYGNLTREVVADPRPFVDWYFNGDNHGAYTHLFQEGMLNFRHGAGAGSRFRRLVAAAQRKTNEDHLRKKFWEKFYDGLFDEYDKSHINAPEGLGKLLRKHLGIPMTLRRPTGAPPPDNP